jgi:cytochrome P450
MRSITEHMEVAKRVAIQIGQTLEEEELDLHTAALAVAIGFVLFLMLKHLKWYLRVAKLPGPKPTTLFSRIFGNACELLTLDKDIVFGDKLEADVMAYFAENMKAHLNEGFFAMHMWPLKKGMVMVYDPNVVKFILSLKGHQLFNKGKIYSIAECLVGKGVMSADGPVWHKQRKLIEKGFRLKTLELAVDATQHTMRDLYPLWDKACETSGTIDVLGDMLKVTMDVLGHVAFSYSFGSVRAGNMTADDDAANHTGAEVGEKLGAPLYDAFRVILGELSQRVRAGSWRKYVPSADTSRFNKAVQDLDTVVDRVIDERRARVKQEEATALQLDELQGSPTDGLLPPTLEINEAPVQRVKLLDNADNDVLSELLAPSADRSRSRSRTSSADAASTSCANGDSKWGSCAPSTKATEKNDGALTNAQISDNIKTFLFAGHDTTASALSWALYLITTHPEVEEKLLQELSNEMLPCFDTGSPRASTAASPRAHSTSGYTGGRSGGITADLPPLLVPSTPSSPSSPASAYGRDTTVGGMGGSLGSESLSRGATNNAVSPRPRTASLGKSNALSAEAAAAGVAARARACAKADKANKVSEIRSLRYLDAVVKEVLRLCPSAGFTRRPVNDTLINGHTIPAGTEMVIFPWLLHQHPDMGEDAGLFEPDRWMDKDSAKAKLAKHMYMPFSLGPRNCVGMQLALTEIKTALILILQRYRFKLADTASPPPKMVCLMTLFPSDIALVPERRIVGHHERFQSTLKKSPSSLGFI